MNNMSNLVNEIFDTCILRDNESSIDWIIVNGVLKDYVFECNRIWENKDNIKELVKRLPSEFQRGASFHRLGYDNTGNVWTYDQLLCDKLAALGCAANLMFFTIPTKLAKKLQPNVMPYVIVK